MRNSRSWKEKIRRFLPERSSRHAIWSGALRGLKIHTSWHDYPGAILGATERPLLAWFAANVRLHETWLDIGGHYGYTAIALSRLAGLQGRVFAFEPVIATAGCLCRTRDLNALQQMTVIPLALGSSPQLQSLTLPLIRGMADSTAHSQASAQIFSIALDAIWPGLSAGNPQIHGVKIDVQGLELDVLLGMREQLARWTPKLVVEFHPGVNRGDVLDLLAACGYSRHFQPIGRAPAGIIVDDISYVFTPEEQTCAYSSTRSIIVRS